ncbi:MAG: metallophosphoesterase [Candidatus Sulfotelmatobacter sp.]
MRTPSRSFARTLLLASVAAILITTSCTKKSIGQTSTIDLQLKVSVPFRFVAYGDSRFHDPKDTEAANPAVRIALVQAIAAANPAFICFTGDLVYNGYDKNDWKVWDSETGIWREKNIPVYPTIGNHELHGDESVALGNYFERFPDLKNSRHYSLRAANILLLVLDSSMDEASGPQGDWLAGKLDSIPPDVDFVFLMLHHPPYTSSSDMKMFGGGHSARAQEKQLAKMLEARQPNSRARFIVFSGHVHNYERHEHGGVTYFVSGGGGAHAYPINRAPDDPFQSKEINYHYLLVEVDHGQLKVTMNRLELTNGKEIWTQPDSVKVAIPEAAAAKAAAQ